ncbi:T-cell surface glycoprotein CD8 beta chain [Pseudorasbora parva]|uniref:T-cell surface glycoprotein CD8 beta chain n=1 Tax=Pseudorasbora parva TaxID=51549 RepID=UPI00351E565A
MTLSCMCCYLFMWMAVVVQPSFQATSNIFYSKINGTESLLCECPDHACQEVFWYRYLESEKTLQFLLYVNSAGREQHGENIKTSQFKGFVSTGQKVVYTLRIMEIQEGDAGFYSCIFKTKNIIPAGYYIMPGVNPPTVQPPTVKTQKPVKLCPRRNPNYSPKGCEHLVLWPGIGALLLLAITLAGTLFYFSRLPKKCRHRFTKTNPLR